MQARFLPFALLAALALTGCDRSAPSADPAPIPPATNTAEAKPSTTQGELARLLGRWVRPDGGYVLEFSELLPDGKLKAGYFNPRPINVSQAEARKDTGALKVFVELRDQNYPGATYKLTHDPQRDVLVGEYFQPMAGETYTIYFERQREPGR